MSELNKESYLQHVRQLLLGRADELIE